MIRRSLAALTAVLVLPSAASAASFAELPYTTAPQGVSCLRSTEVPGELLAWAPTGAQLLQAAPGGLTPAATVALGHLDYCPVIATRPNGEALIAGIAGDTLAYALREGGAWGVPQTLKIGGTSSRGLAVAVSPSGHALIAWADASQPGAVVRAIRRTPGGAFGAPETISPRLSDTLVDVAAGIGDDGVAIVIYQPPGRSANGGVPTEQSLASAGAPFAAPAPLATGASEAPQLAVAPDGRALAVFDTPDIRVAERPPGGSFGPAEPLSEDGSSPAVAIRPDGSAIVAWRDEDGLVVARRTGTGPLGPPIEVLPRRDVIGISGSSERYEGDPAPPGDDDGLSLRMAAGADGSTVFTWGEGARRFGVDTTRPRVAVLPAGGFTATAQTLGGPVRPVSTLTPLVAAGSPALAWGDFGDDGLDGRLHFAAQGAPVTPPVRPPAVRVGKPRRAAVHGHESFVLPLSCSAACDVRGSAGSDHDPVHVSLHHAGRTALRLPSDVATHRLRPVHVSLIASAPGSSAVRDVSVDPRLRLIPEPPLPPVHDLVAVRHGSKIEVSWRIDRPAPDVLWFVTGESRAVPDFIETHVSSSASLTFHATLRHAEKDIRTVRLLEGRDGGTRTRQTTAKVR